jgi:hypothetical protein
MRDRHWCKKWMFQQLLKGLKFSDIWTIYKTHNKFLAHELKMRFKPLNFARKLCLMLLKKTASLLGKIYLEEHFLFFYIILPKQSIFIKTFMKWTDLWNLEPFQNCLLFLYTLYIEGTKYLESTNKDSRWSMLENNMRILQHSPPENIENGGRSGRWKRAGSVSSIYIWS